MGKLKKNPGMVSATSDQDVIKKLTTGFFDGVFPGLTLTQYPQSSDKARLIRRLRRYIFHPPIRFKTGQLFSAINASAAQV